MISEGTVRVGQLQIARRDGRVLIIETEADEAPETFACVVIRTPLEAETLARVLVDQFGIKWT